MRFVWKIGVVALLTTAVTACQPAAPAALPTYTPFPTYTPYPTYTPAPTPVQQRLPSADLENLIWPTGPRDDVIPVEDAADFIGDRVTVEGTVSRTHNAGSAVFLNFDHDGQEVFTAVIFPDDWPKFPSPPENLFAGKLVRIEGLIEEYQGKAEIIVNDPHQTEVALTLGEPVVTECNCVQPTATAGETPAALVEPEPAQSEIATTTVTIPVTDSVTSPSTAVTTISWQDAANFEGQTVSVTGQVVDTYNSGKVVFLNFSEDFRNSFKVVVFPDAWSLFPEPPEQYFANKTIEVTGQIEIYQNAPEIIVDHPNQIEILE